MAELDRERIKDFVAFKQEVLAYLKR